MAGGGGGGKTAGGHKKARIEIIPLIDIMFFLLASFMLVSMSMIKLGAGETKLPNAQTAKPVNKPDFVAIGVDKDNKYYFEKDPKPVAVTEIRGLLNPKYQKQGADKLKVFINADKSASYSAVVAVLDQIRMMGIEQVSFPVAKDNHFDPNTAKNVVPVTAPAAP